MNFALRSADKHQRVESTVLSHLFTKLDLVDPSFADVILVPISYYDDFVCADLHIDKPYVIIDFVEYCWDWDASDTHIFGKNTKDFKRCQNPEYLKFDDFVKKQPPLLYFKRELLQKDQTKTLKPIEYLCYLPKTPLATKEDYDKRDIEVLFNWGLSHPLRPQLHADIFSKAQYELVSQWDHVLSNQRAKTRTWASIHTPHYARSHHSIAAECSSRSKICVSLPGCGVKCFRSAEAPVNSLMASTVNNLAWSYPWTKDNSILLNKETMWADLDQATQRTDLYDRYVAGQKNIDCYRPNNYLKNYFLPAIAEAQCL